MNKPPLPRMYDSIIIVLLIIVGVLLVNPFHLWMPGPLEMIFTTIFAALFILFAVFFWKEDPVDEREAAHIAFSGRIAFIVGAIILAIGTVIESVQHTLDPWMPIALVSMIAAKYIARLFAEKRK